MKPHKSWLLSPPAGEDAGIAAAVLDCAAAQYHGTSVYVPAERDVVADYN